jgi:hypothetical protein
VLSLSRTEDGRRGQPPAATPDATPHRPTPMPRGIALASHPPVASIGAPHDARAATGDARARVAVLCGGWRG